MQTLAVALALAVLCLVGEAKAKKGLITNIESSRGNRENPPRPFIPGTIHTHSLSLGIGQVFLYGELGKHGTDSIIFDLHYTFSASHSFSFFTNTHYSIHKKEGEEKEAKLMGIAPGIKAHLWQFDSLSPYTLAGLGFYATRTTDDQEKAGEGVTLGIHMGAGIDLLLNERVVTGVLLHIHNPFNPEAEAHKKAGGFYGKMMLNIGYTF